MVPPRLVVIIVAKSQVCQLRGPPPEARSPPNHHHGVPGVSLPVWQLKGHMPATPASIIISNVLVSSYQCDSSARALAIIIDKI